MDLRPRLELANLHASGVHVVAVRAPDGSRPECLACDESLYTVEQALLEDPLPHSPTCTCFYAPRWWMDEETVAEIA